MKRLASVLLAALAGCGLRLGAAGPGEPGAAEPGRPCASAADCPRPREACMIAACSSGTCAVEVAPAGLVPGEQARGDCREIYCDGRGRALTREDPTDTPADDANPCTEERCAGDRAEHAPLAAGAPCGAGGVCNGAGACGVCVPEKARCSGAVASLCDATGQWQSRPPCASPAVCSPFAPSGCSAVTGLALGDATSCTLLADGSARCFGAELSGARVRVLDAGAEQIALGARHGCVRLVGGAVQCWGDNTDRQLGDGTRAPHGHLVPVAGLAGAAQIAAGAAHTCARLAQGGVVCWGDGRRGQLGDGGEPEPKAPPAAGPRGASGLPATPEQLLRGPFTELALRLDRACARLAGGAVECWGPGATPLHAAPPEAHSAPPPPPSAPAKAVSGPAKHPPAKHARPPHKPPLRPPERALRPVSGLAKVTEIALGDAFSCARLADGAVACWGANDTAQLGDGSAADRRTPSRVNGVRRAIGLAAGRAHACALLEGGKVMCWGANGAGQLGGGPAKPHRRAEVIANLGDVVSIAARGDRTCAVSEDGSLRCWGEGAVTPGQVP